MIGTNNTSKYTTNEAVNKILNLNSFTESNAERYKVTISTLVIHVGNLKSGIVVRMVF